MKVNKEPATKAGQNGEREFNDHKTQLALKKPVANAVTDTDTFVVHGKKRHDDR